MNIAKVSKKAESSLVQSNRTKAAKKAIIMVVSAVSLVSIAAIGASAVSVNLSPITADFKSESIKVLKNVIKYVGAGVGVWGVVNLIEGYGNDNAGAKSQGIKQLVAGVALFGATSLADSIF